MLSHLKEATVFALKAIATFFRFFWFGIIALTDWLKGFAVINEWVFGFLLPKVLIVLIGMLMTPLSLPVLILISFLPRGAAYAIIFLAFIFSFMQF